MEAELTEEQVKLINIIDKFYKPARNSDTPPLMYTTNDLFRRLRSVYPSFEYTPADVYTVMDYLDYPHLISTTANVIYWLLRERE